MSKQEVLTKAIQKAIANGWNPTDEEAPTVLDVLQEFSNWKYVDNPPSVPEIIFNHDFAKALWGGNVTDAETGERLYPTRHFDGPNIWQEHLQQMVIAEDPIAYLAESLENYNKSDSAKGVL